MAEKLCCFNIGTGHNRNEETNLLVKLSAVCTAGAGYNLLNDGVGSADPSDWGGLATGKSGWLGKKGFDAGNIQGWGIKDMTERTVAGILAQRATLREVYIAGHSRGAIMSIRIAARLWEEVRSGIKVYLFLLDPVQMSGLGKDFHNREIHPNVKGIRVVVAEDLHNKKGIFPAKTLKTRGGFLGQDDDTRADLNPEHFIRIPGGHGTGSQVNPGMPIGQLVYQLARRDFKRWGAPMNEANIWKKSDFCRCYFDIQMVNPIVRVERNRFQKLFGYTELRRRVNDEDAKSGWKEKVTTDSRSKRFDGKGITNRFRGNHFFVNEHHYALFCKLYPLLGRALSDRWENPQCPIASPGGVQTEILMFKTFMPNGYSLLRDFFPDVQACEFA